MTNISNKNMLETNFLIEDQFKDQFFWLFW